MAKRGAEKQLTQDNVEEDDRAETADGEFAKASEQALAGRKIRGMPKRAAARTAAAAAPTAAADAPKAPLFGAASTASNPFAALSNSSNAPAPAFTFGAAAAPAPAPAPPKGTAAPPTFNFAPSSSSSTFSFSAPQPSGSAAPPPAAPKFSFGGSSSGAFGSSSFGSSSACGAAPAPATAPAAAAAPATAPAPASHPAAAAKTERSQSPALTYYTSLRALNLSFVDALTDAIEKDAFVDLAADGLIDKLRDKYTSYRSKVQSEYDASREGGVGTESSSKASEMEVDKPQQQQAPAFEIPEIFRNPPKPVPIADLSETGQSKATPVAPANKPFAPTVAEDEIPAIFRNPPKPVPIADLSEETTGDKHEIPAIFRNPPKPVPIADLSETGNEKAKEDSASSASTAAATTKSMAPTVDESEIPAIFRNPPKPVPIADLTEKQDEAAKKPPAPPAVFSFAGSTVKASTAAPSASSSSSSGKLAAGGFVFKADATTGTEKSSFSFPPVSASPTTPFGTTSSPASAPAAAPTSANSESSTKPSSSSNRDELKPPSAPKLAPAKLTNPPAKPSPLRFGQSASPPTSPEKPEDAAAAKPKGGFSFGAQFGGIAKGNDADATKQNAEKKTEVSAAPAAAKPAFSFGSSSTTSTTSPFSFGSTSAAPTSGTTSGFTFGAATTAAPAGATPASSTSAATTSSTTTKPVPFTFGAANPFSTSTSAGGFGAGAANSTTSASSPGAAGSPPASFGFGAALQGGDGSKARSAGFGFGSGIGSPGGSTSSSGAGAAAPVTTLSEKDQPAKATFGFSFGTGTGTTSASSSFGAGTTTTTPAAPALVSEAPKTESAFSFMPSGPSIVSRKAAAAGGDDSTAPPSEAATDSRAQTPGANPFTGQGEGEEGEEVLHAARCRAYQLKGGEAENLGIANVQLKEKDGKVRMLGRHDTNGKVLINFSLYSNLTLKREKVFLTFMGFDEQAKPATYRLRFKTVEGVEEFEQAVADAKDKLSS